MIIMLISKVSMWLDIQIDSICLADQEYQIRFDVWQILFEIVPVSSHWKVARVRNLHRLTMEIDAFMQEVEW